MMIRSLWLFNLYLSLALYALAKQLKLIYDLIKRVLFQFNFSI